MDSTHYARYPLAKNGVIRHWLARDAKTERLDQLDHVIAPTGDPFDANGRAWITNAPMSLHLKKHIHDHLQPFGWQPEPRPYHLQETPAGRWEYRRVYDDRTIDFNRFNFTPALMRGWTYVALEVETAKSVVAHLHTVSPTQVWLNSVLVFQYDASVGYVHPETHDLCLNLQAGMNDLFLCGVMTGWREARIALGLTIETGSALHECIPIGSVDPARWHAAEAGLESIVLRQFAFPTLPGYLAVSEHAAAPFDMTITIEMPIPDTPWAKLLNLKLPREEKRLVLHPGERGELPITDALLEAMASLPGENHLELTIRPSDGTPLVFFREIWASKSVFQDLTYSTYDNRKREALAHAARMPGDVMATMCAVASGRAEHADADAIALACDFMEDRRDCADFYAVSLLALMHKYGNSPALLPAQRERIEAAFRGFKYWIEEPGVDAMCYFTENHQILFHVTSILAAQYWHEWAFASGATAAELKARASRDAEAWIRRRLRGSFSEWDSNAYMALDAFAMLVLNEFGDDERLNTLARALLDKIFFLIACQSYRGSHSSTHGRCYVSGLKSSRFENTSGLQRIAWGMGIFNGETRATGMLALAEKYRVPDVIQRIGAHLPAALVTRARSSADYLPRHDLKSGEWDARTITRRTPDYMLSACVDHRPGETGIQEHLWQATFSPEAVAFTTYPGNDQEHGNARPNFWAGSVELPRVAMHDKTVICIYHLKPHVGLGFSHAYFPTTHFDEWRIEGHWALARHGDGYLALWSDGFLHLTTSGAHAMQELRSSSGGNAWVAHIGSASENGSFSRFCDGVLRTAPLIENGRVTCIAPSGDALAFGWTGDLIINGVTVSWADFPHYENLYTQTPMGADIMTITHDGQSHTIPLNP